jgi:DNA-binding MarR family transcriptional regulator
MVATNEKIKQQLMQVINKILLKEKKRIVEFEGVSLYPSEVHLMLMIKDKINTNATEMAKQFGLTKGAVSQTIGRLEKKGMLRKTKDPQNNNELTISLTETGEKAYSECKKSEVKFMTAHDDYLSKLQEEDQQVVLAFLNYLEESLDVID